MKKSGALWTPLSIVYRASRLAAGALAAVEAAMVAEAAMAALMG